MSMRKLSFVIGFGAGYVLGSRAGRERYEQLRRLANRVAGSPKVREATDRARESASFSARRGLSLVQRGVTRTGGAVRERLNREEDPTSRLIDLVDDQSGRHVGTG